MSGSDKAPPRGRLIGMLGPTFVGKSTLGKCLVETGRVRRAKLYASRRPRPSENDPDMVFCSASDLEGRQADPNWIIMPIYGEYYGYHVPEIAEMLQTSHVVVGVTVDTVAQVKQRLPDLITLLLWPADFERMQRELSQSPERFEAEKALRLRLNLRDQSQMPPHDLKIEISRVPPEAVLDYHRGLARDFVTVLDQRS